MTNISPPHNVDRFVFMKMTLASDRKQISKSAFASDTRRTGGRGAIEDPGGAATTLGLGLQRRANLSSDAHYAT